jgi:hypothetical protein
MNTTIKIAEPVFSKLFERIVMGDAYPLPNSYVTIKLYINGVPDIKGTLPNGVSEVSAPSYNQVSVLNWKISKDGLSISNVDEINFNIPTETWGTVFGFSIYKGSDMMFIGEFDNPISVGVGQQIRISKGGLNLTSDLNSGLSDHIMESIFKLFADGSAIITSNLWASLYTGGVPNLDGTLPPGVSEITGAGYSRIEMDVNNWIPAPRPVPASPLEYAYTGSITWTPSGPWDDITSMCMWTDPTLTEYRYLFFVYELPSKVVVDELKGVSITQFEITHIPIP